MNTIRGGKIARLPKKIREQVNQRLADHESSTPLLKWLNALPEVRAVLAREFGGRPIVRNNVYEWRRGGFAEWQRHAQAGELMERLGAKGNEMSEQDPGVVLGTMTTFAAARYVMAIKNLEGQGGDGGKGLRWGWLREFCGDLVALRKGEQLAARLEFEREKVRAMRGMQ
jgi:hypothetical protein